MELQKEEVEYLLSTAINFLVNKGSQIVAEEDNQDHLDDFFPDIESTIQ
jgi:hypothetical protein